MTFMRIVVIAYALLAGPSAPANAQTAGKTAHVGILSGVPLSSPSAAPLLRAFLESLRDRGWDHGRNLVVENRFTEGRAELFPQRAAELVALKADVIVATNSQAVAAAKASTTTIPIVMIDVSHPVEAGFVESLARPGGNVTGTTNQLKDLVGKHTELLREVKPRLQRIGVLYTPNNVGSALGLKAQQEALALDPTVSLIPIPLNGPEDLESALGILASERPEVLQVHPTPIIISRRVEIAKHAAQHRIPTITAFKSMVRDGLLMSYGPDQPESWRRAAIYVDRILKGTSPAELPVEQPTKFELVINLNTARTLGLTISPSLLARVDEVIE